ncbi:MAG: holo-ACP synthase [Aquificaceae bacterium]|nr:holo-ACP synthase [Aquificaceae bacterium]MCS7196667.1 holo-ACP synthase [Aquificaceae bacterium]MCX7989877.1 holo-ACP synthase [Aquificaceae bacterium]MDW8032143.1 holo-ACP synthase [Aquificaceae bacterium]MDW8293964.1 holo-ACP synthase [Aquificaceae bacterium]
MVGIDIVKNQRIREAVERFGERFLRRIYTEKELAYCGGQQAYYECLSARWACKEAVLKAFYQSYGVLLKFSEIEVLGDRGRPARVNILKEGFDGVKVLVSLSHERDFSVAVAYLLKE